LADLQELAGAAAPAAGRLPTVDAPCGLCGGEGADPVWTTRDRAFGVPGLFTVARCRDCGFLYQRPRIRDDRLADCYPDHYPRHRESSPRHPLKGSPRRQRAVRWALATALGYSHLAPGAVSALTRARGRLLLRRLRWDCPHWIGQGRYLDVGCGSGGALARARALGWTVTGIEMDVAAAARARRFADEVFAGDILAAPFAEGRFDLVTSFHVLEHVPDPVRVLKRMLDWTAPGGMAVVEVPNAAGLGARLFGPAWSSLELPRHLSHFTPESLERAIERAGGRVLRRRQQAKPRHHLWSLGHWLRDRELHAVARLAEARPVYGVLKLGLELALPAVSRSGRGEAMRVAFARRPAGAGTSE
jgi:SAM-dependent methyltransferase